VGDQARLLQVFTNLLNNAAKYTPDGGEIQVLLERSGDDAVVRVIDNGIGIRPDLLDRIFDLFEQGDGALDRSEGGLGIGLTLVRKIIDLHRGSVFALSEGPGLGTTIVVRLPLSQEPASAPVPETRQRPEPAAQSSLRVLVVDDNVDAASSLSTLLTMTGHQVRTEHTGPLAMTSAMAWNPQVVLLDIGLPGMDGHEVASQLRESGFKGMIVALTGYGQESDRARSAMAGFDLHLVKPVDFERMREVLETVPSG
jgi:CheY-like chemotaxis protein